MPSLLSILEKYDPGPDIWPWLGGVTRDRPQRQRSLRKSALQVGLPAFLR